MQRVLIMPLEGGDDAGLFCIMLPQKPDRSLKTLEALRPYEYASEHYDSSLFANNYMLLTLRYREKHSDLLGVVDTTLAPVELSGIKSRPGRERAYTGPGKGANLMPTVEKVNQKGQLQKIPKRKHQQTIEDGWEFREAPKKSRMRPLTGPRMSMSGIQLPDDDMTEPLQVPNARISNSRIRVQEQTPISPIDVHMSPAAPTPIPQTEKTSHFTDEQALRIQFRWEVNHKDLEWTYLRTLSATKTFSGLLHAYRDDAQDNPLAVRQLDSRRWALIRRLADGKGKARLINLNDLHFEQGFDGLLRLVAGDEAWKQDSSVTVDIELRAMQQNKDI